MVVGIGERALDFTKTKSQSCLIICYKLDEKSLCFSLNIVM